MADESILSIESYRHNVEMILDCHRVWRVNPSEYNTTRLRLMFQCIAGVNIGALESTPILDIIVGVCGDYYPQPLEFFNARVVAKWSRYSGDSLNPLGIDFAEPLWSDANAARQYAFAEYVSANLASIVDKYHARINTASKMGRKKV